MCATCGCGSQARATLTNLATGKKIPLDGNHAHEHEHTHADGTRHRHSHGHDHGHEHGDDHTHEHEHVHADGMRHSHSHSHDHGHEHGDDHSHEHEHVHADGRRHSHPHGHDHRHAHGDDHSHEHEHAHADGSRHSHAHGHGHDHRHDASEGISPGSIVALEARVLAKNDALAAHNRAWFAGREILALNLVSSPGAGKTTLLERTIRDLLAEMKLFVVEGDQATSNDGERIRAAGAPVVQVNTGTGCHLEADMLERGLRELKPSVGSVVLIENVGNLVCPALFDLGERAKVVIFSVTEGEDKPLKYPHMFRAAALMILSKIDLLPHVDFDADRALANARQVNPNIVVLRVSARTGEGLDDWYAWLRAEAARIALGK